MNQTNRIAAINAAFDSAKRKQVQNPTKAKAKAPAPFTAEVANKLAASVYAARREQVTGTTG